MFAFMSRFFSSAKPRVPARHRTQSNLALLDSIGRLSAELRLNAILKSPQLLSAQTIKHLVKAEESLKDPAAPPGIAARRCWQAIQEYGRNIQTYPLGQGPIERLLDRHEGGEISFAAALSLAGTAEFADQLSFLYAQAVSMLGEDQAHSGAWRSAVKLQRLLLAAVDHHEQETDEGFKTRVAATLSWLEIATSALIDVPDGRLYQDVKQRSMSLATEAKQRNDRRLRGEALHRLGILHVDTYISGRASTGFEQQLRLWEQRAYDEFGAIVAAQADVKMPTAAEAFAAAKSYLTESAALRQGVDRARTLKVLAEALVWSKLVGGRPSEQLIDKTIDEAISLFDPARDAIPISALRSLQNFARRSDAKQTDYDKSPDDPRKSEDALALAEVLRSAPDDKVIKAAGEPLNTGNFLLQAAKKLSETDIVGAMHVLNAVERMSKICKVGEDYRHTILVSAIKCLIPAYQQYPILNTSDRDKLLRELNKIARAEEWSLAKRTSILISAAVAATASDREEFAISIFSYTKENEAAFWEDHKLILDHFWAVALVGAARNAIDVKACGRAAELYLGAFRSFILNSMPSRAVNMLNRVADLTTDASGDDLERMVPPLAIRALDAEKAGRAGIVALQAICDKVLARMLELGDANATVMFFVFQIGKGLRFGHALTANRKYRWCEDTVAKGLHDQVENFRSQAEDKATPPPEIFNEAILCSYVSSEGPAAGSDAQDIMRNLMHRFDLRVNDMLLKDQVLALGSFLTPDAVQNVIDERTVVLNYYITTSTQQKPLLFCLVLSRTSLSVVVNAFSDQLASDVGLTLAGHQVMTDFIGLKAIELRSMINEKPKPGCPGSPACIEALTEFGQIAFGTNLLNELKQLRASGCDHLCIVPHRALHFCPFHAAIIGNTKTLGDEWVVTYAPNLRLLTQRSEAPSQEELSAFGVSFAGDKISKLPALPEAAIEAAEIAELFGATALIDGQATKEAVLSAFETSKRVHVATHGEHAPDAPSFQRIFLERPDGLSDSINAYELLGRNFEGLDLLTLSACETALGRFDLMDNLRGLPANLYLGGADTLIGTLWPIETRSAAFFFLTLYREIAAGSSKLDAFRTSQLRTREAHPEYRDWAAFYYAGRW